MTPDKTCPVEPCVVLLEIIRTNPEKLDSTRTSVCSNYIACPQYHILSGVNQAIIDAVANYDKIKQNTQINTESLRQK